ncbi:MAG TPA: DUF58 domain-containing protein [Polyangia bacterium]|jgi:uncharacterized protein (DUF58 family)|nr:DUF58 domain-containing protein [Polyangia bacterium]
MLTRELLKKIRKIEIVTERLVRDRMAGQYHSVFKGSGIAFSEVRQYMPGDDIRQIDWNVSARMNDVYIKLFTEEREMTVLLLVDMSASGNFGSRTQEKRELAAEIAAVLAFSAIRNNDRVGLIIFTDDVEKFVPPKKGKKHVLRVISEILSFAPKSPRTNIGAGLQFLGRIARRRAVAFLISDFLASPASYERALRITAGRHDLVPVSVTDPLEEALPAVGFLELEDPETGEVTLFDTSGPEGRAFAAEARRLVTAREALFRRLDMDTVKVRTDRPYLPALTSFFEARARRLRH